MENKINHLLNTELKGSLYNSRLKYYQNCFNYAKNLYSKNLIGHYGCVNAVEFSNRESEHFASGSDDKRILIWSIDKHILSSSNNQEKPICLKSQHNSNIFTLAWDNENKNLFSGGNDEQVIVHDVKTLEVVDVFLHFDAVLCISVHPQQSEIFATACENGQVCLYDLRLSNADPIVLTSTSHSSAYQACCFNPTNSSLIAAANVNNGIQLIDIRMQNKVLIKYAIGQAESFYSQHKPMDYKQNVMSVKFNDTGTQLCALRSKLPPILYNTNDAKPVCQFDYETYLNACTSKSCCFAGESDQYVCSGSDDFNVYIWRIPEDSEKKYETDVHLKLKGHRSIVNQVRFNKNFQVLATSGVEKLIKIWSPYNLPESNGGLQGLECEYVKERTVYRDADVLLGPLEGDDDQSLNEDEQMIAYFDMLVRKIARGETDEDEDNDEQLSTDTSTSNDGFDNSNDDDNEERDSTSQYSESTSTSQSSTSSSNTDKKILKISLRDRVRNLRHRRSLNLTENSEFKSVLSSLNVNNDDESSQDEEENVSYKYFNKSSNQIDVSSDDQIQNIPSTSAQSSLSIKNLLNEKRKIIECTDEDAQHSNITTIPSTSTGKFKLKKKLVHNQYRINDNQSSGSNSDTNEDITKKFKKS